MHLRPYLPYPTVRPGPSLGRGKLALRAVAMSIIFTGLVRNRSSWIHDSHPVRQRELGSECCKLCRPTFLQLPPKLSRLLGFLFLAISVGAGAGAATGRAMPRPSSCRESGGVRGLPGAAQDFRLRLASNSSFSF